MKVIHLIQRDLRSFRFEGVLNGFVIGVALVGLIAVLNGVHRMHDYGIWHF
jgi:tetrahydromethanopterin S-methyltransferase subunit B